MNKKPFVICITGSAGNIGSLLIFDILHSPFINALAPIELRLFDLPSKRKHHEGLLLELEDCGFACLKSATLCDETVENFEGADLIILLSGRPRQLGQERKDLIGVNVSLFKKLALLINPKAKPGLKVLVVANPCNSNAYVFSQYAPNIPKDHIHSLSRLDFNRAVSFLTKLPSVAPFKSSLKGVGVWGNHSKTMFLEINSATVEEEGVKKPLTSLITKEELYGPNGVMRHLQKRGMEIIEKTEKSANFSASWAIMEHLRDWLVEGPESETRGPASKGLYCESIKKRKVDCWVSMPAKLVRGEMKVSWEMLDAFGETDWEMLNQSLDELEAEKKAALDYLAEKKELEEKKALEEKKET